MFIVKISSVCLDRKRAQVGNSGNFHRSFQNDMAPYSSNFGDKLRMIFGIGKRCAFMRIGEFRIDPISGFVIARFGQSDR